MARRGGKSPTSFSASTKKPFKALENHQHQQLSSLIPLLTSAISAIHTFLYQNEIDLLPSQNLTLESKISSTAFSLSKLHSLLQIPQNPSQTETLTLTLPHHSDPLCWFHRFNSESSDTQWVEAFRISRASFNLLLQTLSPSLDNSTSTLPPDYLLGAALFRLAHAASYKAVGRRFGVDSESACRAFYEVCKALIDRLGHLLEFPSDLNRILKGFGSISLPNCCGILGFSRFLVTGGGGEGGKDNALIVQALVDSEGRFLDVSAGWPSSMSPSTILPQTIFFSRVVDSRELLSGEPVELPVGHWLPQYILGGSCCPLLPWLLTPYPKSSKESKLIFNSVHNRGMGLVNTTFSRVKAQWKLLSMEWKEECAEFFPFVIVAGCVLHNFLMKCSEVVPDESDVCSLEQGFPMCEGKANEIGERIRDALAAQMGLNEEHQNTTMSVEDKRLYRLT